MPGARYLETGSSNATSPRLTASASNSAVKVFVTNIGADYETPSYTTADYVNGAYRYLSLGAASSLAMSDLFSAILVNNGRRKADEKFGLVGTIVGEQLCRL